MTLKDLLHKHKHLQQTATAAPSAHPTASRRSTDRTTRSSSDQSSAGPDLPHKVFDVDNSQPIPEFTFLRTTTHDQEVIKPPHYPEDDKDDRDAFVAAKKADAEGKSPEKAKKRRSLFRNRSGTVPSRTPSSKSVKSIKSDNGAYTTPHGSPPLPQGAHGFATPSPTRPDMKRKLSERLHLSGGRARAASRASDTSPNLPDDLDFAPEPIPAPLEAPDARGKVKEVESKEARAKREEQWVKRACALAMNLHVPTAGPWGMAGSLASANTTPGRKRTGSFVDEKEEVNIQEAIRLHESGNLERSTAIFGRLADPKGTNNPLSQVLYGLALRHGWGIEPSYDLAILYLSLAARTSAQIEQLGNAGEAKGELILAMFELGNCYRFGWGCKIDKAAARVFYEVAANLGDPDALEEAAWCCMEGFGGSKDKVSFRRFLFLSIFAPF